MRKLFNSVFWVVMSLFMLTFHACEEKQMAVSAEYGTIGDIQVDREKIGACQPFTLTSQVTRGKDVFGETWEWINPLGIPAPVTIKDNKAVYSTSCKEVGAQKYSLRYMAMNPEGEYKFTVKEIVLDILQPDVRNSFWNETLDECVRNLGYYSTTVKKAENMLMISEPDSYHGIGLGDRREVSYHFTAGKLEAVMYDSDISGYEDKKVINSLGVRALAMEKDGFKNLSYDYKTAPSVILTAQEKELAEKFTTGELKKLDPDGVLGKSVKEGRIELVVNGTSEVSRVMIEAGSRDGKSSVGLLFTPAAK